jgi:hypothetical protein
MPQHHGAKMHALLSSLVVLAICTVLQTTDGGFAQVVVATPDRRRRSPIFADVGKGAIDIELLRESLVTLTSRCDEEGFALIGNECSPCPSGATCPGAHFACFRQISTMYLRLLHRRRRPSLAQRRLLEQRRNVRVCFKMRPLPQVHGRAILAVCSWLRRGLLR